jgi:hypothetical protein
VVAKIFLLQVALAMLLISPSKGFRVMAQLSTIAKKANFILITFNTKEHHYGKK